MTTYFKWHFTDVQMSDVRNSYNKIDISAIYRNNKLLIELCTHTKQSYYIQHNKDLSSYIVIIAVTIAAIMTIQSSTTATTLC